MKCQAINLKESTYKIVSQTNTLNKSYKDVL